MPEDEEDLIEVIRGYALANAVRHGGKAELKPVLSRVFAENPELRNRARDLIRIVEDVVEEVNSKPVEEQDRLLRERYPGLLEAAGEAEAGEKALPPLPDAYRYGRVVTRFSPNPDCVLHIGSLRAIILSHEYARMYDGRFILRFEDTDPRLKKASLEYYQAIRDDLGWLGCTWDEEYIQSDRIPLYYEYASRLLRLGGGYVCTCGKEEFKSKVLRGLPCPCRSLSEKAQEERWLHMLDGGFGEGEAVYRVKTDLSHPNPAVRDWPAFRIIDPGRYPHPRVGGKYRVWPLYNFACGVDDHLLGITHVIRGKEHLTNTVRQRYLYSHFGWSYPETIHYGRLRMVDADLSKSSIIRRVTGGEASGFDDPRLATLKALRRRGISPQALRLLILDIGPRPVDATISWENIYAYNRRILEPSSKRYLYVEDPVTLVVEGLPGDLEARIPFHPSRPEMGYRIIHVKPRSDGSIRLLVARSDLSLIRDSKHFRLMGLLNAYHMGVGGSFGGNGNDGGGEAYASYEGRGHEEARGRGIPIIQWVNPGDCVDVGVTMPSAYISRGKGEKALQGVRVDETVQLIRFGFARVDRVEEGSVHLYYAHK
ncbi:MAG: glutamate--tRNA ligase [Candidatus Bathyarchaeia archaeon]